MDSQNYFYSQSNRPPAYPIQNYPGSRSVYPSQVAHQPIQANSVPIQFQNQTEPYSEDVNQVHRWANWVKFVAIFIMLRATLSILSCLFQISFSPKDIETEPFVSQMFILLLLLIVGYIGYRASIRKTAGSAKFYIFCLFAYVTLELIWIIGHTDYILDFICTDPFQTSDEKTGHNTKDTKDSKRCSDDLYNTVMAMSVVIFLIVYACICTPIMWCPYKMYKYAKATETQNANRYQPSQHFQTFGFNPVRGTPIN